MFWCYCFFVAVDVEFGQVLTWWILIDTQFFFNILKLTDFKMADLQLGVFVIDRF